MMNVKITINKSGLTLLNIHTQRHTGKQRRSQYISCKYCIHPELLCNKDRCNVENAKQDLYTRIDAMHNAIARIY